MPSQWSKCPYCGSEIPEHDIVQCAKNRLGLPEPKQIDRRNDVTLVTIAADNKIADLEQAMQRMLIAKPEQREEAHEALNIARRVLYQHIERLEIHAGSIRIVRKVWK